MGAVASSKRGAVKTQSFIGAVAKFGRQGNGGQLPWKRTPATSPAGNVKDEQSLTPSMCTDRGRTLRASPLFLYPRPLRGQGRFCQKALRALYVALPTRKPLSLRSPSYGENFSHALASSLISRKTSSPPDGPGLALRSRLLWHQRCLFGKKRREGGRPPGHPTPSPPLNDTGYLIHPDLIETTTTRRAWRRRTHPHVTVDTPNLKLAQGADTLSRNLIFR